MKKQNRTSDEVKRMCGIAAFSAIAFLVTLIIRIPVQFLTFDVKDAVICLAAFIYGPVSAFLISFIAAFIELVTISSTGVLGFLMNFLSSSAFAFTAAFIYSKRKTLGGAIVGVYSAVVVLTAVMVLLNILITPVYMKVDRAIVVAMLPTLLFPFNLAKGLLNGAVSLMLYKPLVIALRRAHFLPASTKHDAHTSEISADLLDDEVTVKKDRSLFSSNYFSNKTYIPIALGVVTAVVAVVIFIVLNK